MIDEKGFIEKFCNFNSLNFSREYLREAYYAMRKMTVYSCVCKEMGLVRRLALSKIQNLHEMLWPFLDEIGSFDLEINKGAIDDEALSALICSIIEERHARGVRNGQWPWKKFRDILERRAELFQYLLVFEEEDLEAYEKEAENFILEFKKRREETLKLNLQKTIKLI